MLNTHNFSVCNADGMAKYSVLADALPSTNDPAGVISWVVCHGLVPWVVHTRMSIVPLLFSLMWELSRYKY